MRTDDYHLALLCDFYELTMGRGYFNTPMRDRILSWFSRGLVMSVSPSQICPSFTCSSKLTHFMRVDLPEPDGPRSATVSC